MHIILEKLVKRLEIKKKKHIREKNLQVLLDGHLDLHSLWTLLDPCQPQLT